MIGELNASHTYRYGGDIEAPKNREVGYLGIDWTKKDGFFAVGKVIRGAAWDNEVRSSLDEPGINVAEGDYILAVNGVALTDFPDPWAAFEGLADKTVELTGEIKKHPGMVRKRLLSKPCGMKHDYAISPGSNPIVKWWTSNRW
jgi:tricorn protease